MKALAPPLLLLSSWLSLSNPAPTTPAKYEAAKDDIFKRGEHQRHHHSFVTVTELVKTLSSDDELTFFPIMISTRQRR